MCAATKLQEQKARSGLSGSVGQPTMNGMNLNLAPSRCARRVDGYTLVELSIVVLLVGILSAVAWSAVFRPANDARENYIANTLVSVDFDMRSRARDGESVTPAVFFAAAIDSIPDTPAEVQSADDDPKRSRLVGSLLPAEPEFAVVMVVRFGGCGMLITGPFDAPARRVEGEYTFQGVLASPGGHVAAVREARSGLIYTCDPAEPLNNPLPLP
jgi:prepilin-type N-terminal cleavage/methylation domain-containing protein